MKILSCLLATPDLLLQLQIGAAFGSEIQIVLIASDAETALKNSIIDTANEDIILVIDARLPRAANLPPDGEEKAAMWLLRELRARGNNRPALIITSRPLGISEIDIYCNPDNHAIALPQRHLNPSVLAGFISMLSPASAPIWEIIEVDVKRICTRCSLGNRNGKKILWAETSSKNYAAVQMLALQYARPDFEPGWVRRLHSNGAQLFGELVISALGPGLFSHLELAAGGLKNLAFRFCVDDSKLYTVPFEAVVRLSGQPLSGSADDFVQNPFILVHAPITRRMLEAVNIGSAPSAMEVPRPAELLFIRSQVGQNPAGVTGSDTVPIPELDRSTGRILIKHVEFRTLKNIDRELKALKDLEGRYPDMLHVESLDLSVCGSDGAEKFLLRRLNERRFDVVHFAGHSLTTNDSLTLLVLPGEHPGEAEGMAVETFARGAADTGAKLVYLSSCKGSSANTVASLAQRSVPYGLGFRWDVDDEGAAEFAALFYDELFGPSSATICDAFRTACCAVYPPKQIEASRIWASPILASRSDDWMIRRVLSPILEAP